MRSPFNLQQVRWAALAVLLSLLLAACQGQTAAPAASPLPASATPTKTVAPTLTPPSTATPPPSATVDASLPRSCRREGMLTYANPGAGYCFSYPAGFSLQESLLQDQRIPVISGPAPSGGLQTQSVSLRVETRPLPAAADPDLERLVDDYLHQTAFQGLPWEIMRSGSRLGGQPAVVLEDIPGRLSARQVMAIHNGLLYTLTFTPSDQPALDEQLNELFSAVLASFTFLDPARPPVMGGPQRASYMEFGREISLAYDPSLALWVEAGYVPAVPLGDQVLFSESHPAYVRFRFLGYRGGRAYDLPLLPFESHSAQVIVFRSADFDAYGRDDPLGFPANLQSLRRVLESGLDPDYCQLPFPTGLERRAMPFLPWVNARQVFCARLERLDFEHGAGLRYLTAFSQDDSPVLDTQLFYTFQGLSADGELYIAAHFPLRSGIFPLDPQIAGQADRMLLADQLTRLNEVPGEQFDPPLGLLDDLVRSIRLVER